MDLLWQLDFSFGENSCSPKYHPTIRLHCFMCNLCRCPAFSRAGAGGGEGSAFPALHRPSSLGLGARGHSFNKAAQPSPAPCSNIPAFRTALVCPKQQGPIPHPCCFACDISH